MFVVFSGLGWIAYLFIFLFFFGSCHAEEKLFLAGTCKAAWVFIILEHQEKCFCQQK